jgi:hypothetical protein
MYNILLSLELLLRPLIIILNIIIIMMRWMYVCTYDSFTHLDLYSLIYKYIHIIIYQYNNMTAIQS